MIQWKIFLNNGAVLTEIQKQNIHFSETISRNSKNLRTDFDEKDLYGKINISDFNKYVKMIKCDEQFYAFLWLISNGHHVGRFVLAWMCWDQGSGGEIFKREACRKYWY